MNPRATAAAAALVLALAGCGVPTSGSENVGNDAGVTTKASTQKADGAHTVKLAVGGTAKKASVTYGTDGAGGQAQDNETKVPWTKTLKLKGEFLVLTVLAQNQGASGTITCTITVDGKKVKANKSTGGYSIASCTYTVSP